jgi:hypothetical protein
MKATTEAARASSKSSANASREWSSTAGVGVVVAELGLG